MENSLESQIAVLKKSLFDEEFLDRYFIKLEDLQDSVSPDFAEDVFKIFFEDSARRILDMESALGNLHVDYSALSIEMHALRGGASNIGASRLKKECNELKKFLDESNADGCLRTLAKLKNEHSTLESKLQTYFQLVRQARSMESSVEPKP